MKIKAMLQLSRRWLLITVLLLFSFYSVYSQYPVNYQYSLLPSDVVDLIIGSSSGELAMKHINNLAPYSRPRMASEFPAGFKELEYISGKIKEYALSNFSVDTVGQTYSWRAIEGSVWEVKPGNSKIADLNDIPEMLAEGSNNADLTAKLIWAGDGDPLFFKDKSQAIKGNIVVTSGLLPAVHAEATGAGAVGTISYFSTRPLTDPIQIPNIGISGEGFGFFIPPREGQLLRDRLLRKENIEVKVKVKSSIEKTDLLVAHCLIQGTDSTAGEIIFTAHLFEGYVKMGANDNMSGSAVILEVAHLLNDLIKEGKLKRPVRSIRFLWIPEFTGTIPWVNSHLALVKNALCNINLDMVGLRLRDNKSFFCLYRSGYSTANCLNDVMENFYRFTGESNMEGITDGLGRRGFSHRIVSPTGSDDPLYYRIISIHGSSDNAVFNNWAIGVPGVKMNTWPDTYYHSSEDSPDKCDPTQLRRAIFIAAAGAYTMASAGDETSMAILSEMYSSAVTRLGIQSGKASDMIMKAGRDEIGRKYKRAVFNLEGFIMGEKSALEKIRQLSVKPQLLTLMNSRVEMLDNLLKIQVSSLHTLMIERCRYLGIPEISIKMNDQEKAASKIKPHRTQASETMGYEGETKYLSKLPKDFTDQHTYRNIVNRDEVAGLADGKRNLLQIKKIVDAQFEKESPLQDIINYYVVLKEAGLMEY